MSKKIFFVFIGVVSLLKPLCLDSRIVSVSRFTEEGVRTPIESYYRVGLEALEDNRSKEAEANFLEVIHKAPDSPLASDARYHLGMTYYRAGDLQLANDAFTNYLKNEVSPAHFEEVLGIKFEIAECFRQGRKKHLFGVKGLPRWGGGKLDALDIYDEIFTSLPSHELSACALLSKGNLLSSLQMYKEAIETYSDYIVRFPRHAMAAECYLCISGLYLAQAKLAPQDPDLFSLAQINVRKFRASFPTDERLLAAEDLLSDMKEVLAADLVKTGQFYEKVHHPESAFVCYRAALHEYPSTPSAMKAKDFIEKATQSTAP